MPEPTKFTKFVEKDRVDITLEGIIKETQKSGKITQSQFNQAYIAASIHGGVEQYRTAGSLMSEEQLKSEQHDSRRLGRHLVENGFTRPPNCHAHAIVAGKHKYAIRTRLVLTHFGIRIDDPVNGCWLPENTAATPHPRFPNAVPHSRIHRYNYYWWLQSYITVAFARNQGGLRILLKRIANALQTQKGLPDYVMNKKGVGLPINGRL